jgi:hypothetical protein
MIVNIITKTGLKFTSRRLKASMIPIEVEISDTGIAAPIPKEASI